MARRRSRVKVPQPAVMWTWRAVVAAYLCALAGAVAAYMVGRSVTGDRGVAVLVRLYSGGLLGLYVPIFWIRKRYGLGREALGLKGGLLHPMISVVVGITLAIAYYVLVRDRIFGAPLGFPIGPSYSTAILTLLSPVGFAYAAVAPCGEEVTWRGYLYAYLREALGRRPALVLQAVLFCGLHIESWHSVSAAVDAFLMGLILGILYEKTESLYASIACHGTVNYLAVLNGAL